MFDIAVDKRLRDDQNRSVDSQLKSLNRKIPNRCVKLILREQPGWGGPRDPRTKLECLAKPSKYATPISVPSALG